MTDPSASPSRDVWAAVTPGIRSAGHTDSTTSSGPPMDRHSPKKTVAGALKKLFRMSESTKSSSNEHESSTGAPTPHTWHAPLPTPTQPPVTAAAVTGKPRPGYTDIAKQGALKQAPSYEPASVLDDDDRLTDRTATATDRNSNITDRASALSATVGIDRTSSMQPDKQNSAVLSHAPSRSSGSSRLSSYIRSIIKPGSGHLPGGSPVAPAQAGTAAAMPSTPPGRTSHPRDSAGALQGGGGGGGASSSQLQLQQQQHQQLAAIRVYATPQQTAAAPTAPLPPQSPSAAFINLPPSPASPTRLLHPLTAAGSPPGLVGHDYPSLPPPNPAAIARMQRDPNLLTVCNDLPARMDRPAWRVEDYTLQQKVHAGYASAVYKAYCKLSGQTVALKVYQPAKLHEISQFQLYREARLHCQMNHPNIIKLYAAFRHGESVILVQEYADGGDLLQLLMQQGTRLSERRATQLVLQPLLRALYYLHSRFIVHRDIKLENILFHGKDMTLKVADFGLCLNLREERSVTRAGTLDYMAPEVLRCPQKHKPQDNKERLDLAYNMNVDIWALGVVAYELLNGCPPFTCHDKKETEKRINSGLMPEFVVDVSDAARDFVYSCLTRAPEARPTAWALLRNNWIKSGNRSSAHALMHPNGAGRATGNTTPTSHDSNLLALHADLNNDPAVYEPPYVPVIPPPVQPIMHQPAPAARLHTPQQLTHDQISAAMALVMDGVNKYPQQQHVQQRAAVVVQPPSGTGSGDQALDSGRFLGGAYVPGQLAALYAKTVAAADGTGGGVPSSPGTSTTGGRASPNTRGALALVPSSALHLQQQAAAAAAAAAAALPGAGRRVGTRSSAPAASALKALSATSQSREGAGSSESKQALDERMRALKVNSGNPDAAWR